MKQIAKNVLALNGDTVVSFDQSFGITIGTTLYVKGEPHILKGVGMLPYDAKGVDYLISGHVPSKAIVSTAIVSTTEG